MTELEISDIHALRHANRFDARRAKVTALLNAGDTEGALKATRHKHAKDVFQIFQSNPDASLKDVASTLGASRTYAQYEIRRLKELGIPLGKQ